MKILCLSEHFFPRVGGTVNYVHETCSALVEKGLDISLIVPGPKPVDSTDEYSYRVVWLGSGYPNVGEPSRSQRYRFCKEAQNHINHIISESKVDAIHVLFGLFLMEILDTKAIEMTGVRSLVTVHNVPPMECGLSWPEDAIVKRIKENLRLKIVKFKNRLRFRQNIFSTYITPSDYVKAELAQILSHERIYVIGHGVTTSLINHVKLPFSRCPKTGCKIRLLTAGGWAPHKRQHLIPNISIILREKGIDFNWTIAGPSNRVQGYREAVEDKISRLGLSTYVQTFGAVSSQDLARFYDNTHLYLQPSTEEGFCLTALDAAASGIPVIGSPTGALPAICDVSGGLLLPSKANDIAHGVIDYINYHLWPENAHNRAQDVCDRFSWTRAADALISLYMT